MNFKKLNILTGWLVFIVATITYLLTIEPTASFWDCGEFIATAYKLEVGHPPGAPLFMLLARIFGAFMPVEVVPAAINVISALSSSFTILFLFWSITHMARKLALRDGAEWTQGKLIAVIGSGVVGALAYTWSDSFWFSAVEGEVYALSSLFTAVVFWAILKWESEANDKHSTRWLILIAYLVGLSIGVHLLNLLAIPAIAFVYYFKKYETTPKGVAMTFVVSALILGVIQAVIIPGLVNMAGKFELLFVNDMGMPFNSGTLVYALILIGALVWGILWSQRHDRPVLNTALLSVAVIILGYSTFAMIVIRSKANPPIDENNPETVFNLLSYLNREQYGDRPLLSGQFWDAPYLAEREDGKPVHTAVWVAEKDGRPVKAFFDEWSAEQFVEQNPGHDIEHEYKVTDPKRGTEVIYAPEFTMMFPRMYSAQASHKGAYKQWSGFQGKPIPYTGPDGKRTIINKPTQGENMKFFFDYQMGWMYWRYFLWNFAGRQNDIQGHGNITDGNWISGLKFVDAERLGNQDQLPTSITGNKAHNKFYLLPLLLGIIGLVFQLVRHLKDWSIVALLFFFTGVAIVIYLNQYPYQPRERDYAYVGSFYAFAIWIGLGVYALFDIGRSLDTKDLGKVIGIALGLAGAKYLMELVGGGDHATSLAMFFMAGVGGTLLALFYALGRSKNDTMTAALASVLGLLVPGIMVANTWDDHDRGGRFAARDVASNYLESCAPNAILFTNGDNDTFPLWYAQEVEGIRTDIRIVNLSLLNTDWYIDQMRRKAYESDPVPFSIDPAKYRQGTRDVVALLASQNQKGIDVDVKRAVEFATNDKNLQNIFSRNLKDAYMPTDKFKIPVDREKVLSNGTVAIEDTAKIVDEVTWRVPKQVILKNHFMMLDLLGNNDWERPIYFAVTTGPDSYLNLMDYFQLEGLTYRLVPIKTSNKNPNLYGRVGTETMYDNVMNKYRWGGMDDLGGIYLDENALRMATNLRIQMSNLADALIVENKKDKARDVLDLSLEKMPEVNVPFDRTLLPTVEAYYELGDSTKANELNARLFELQEEELNYFMSLEPEFAAKVENDMAVTNAVLQRLTMVANVVHPQGDFGSDLQTRYEELAQAYAQKTQELEDFKSGRTSKIKF